MIPALEKQFRAVGKPGGRFVTGHSSGGWSSLWLQVTYTVIRSDDSQTLRTEATSRRASRIVM